MKKMVFAVMAVLLLSLLWGGSCGPKQEAQLPPTTDQPQTPTQKPEEPSVEPKPGITKLTNADFQKPYFDFDKYNIRPDAARALEHNAQLLKDNPDVRVLIEGHCDERGTVEYNLALGERRAKAIKDYLIRLGIAGDRMETISYGKERPVATGHDEESWQKNRRGEFRVK